MIPSLASVVVLLLPYLSNVAGIPCTEGSMDLSLLNTKAADTSWTVRNLADGSDRKWGIAYSFTESTCSTATLTGFLIGVDIQTERTNTRNEYPKVEIWYKSGDYYNKYSPEKSFTINLSPDNFTTSGLYHYKLPTGISVNGNDRLVVYQPASDTSVVRFYRVTGSWKDLIARFNDINDNRVKVDGSNIEVSWHYRKILLEPILGMFHHNNSPLLIIFYIDDTNCYSIDSTFNTSSLSITSVIPVTDTRVFPDIHFTCTGIITNWLIGITEEQDTTKPYPNIYIKRSSELIHALTVDTSAAISSNGNVYNFTSEVMVQSGDILVINVTSNSNPMYYQQYNGPLNYKLNNDELIPLEDNDYPLVSVIISKSLYIFLFCL